MRLKDEDEIFSWIKDRFIPDLQKPDKANEIYDAISHDKKVVIEFKCRGKHYNSLMIERRKYDNLLRIAKEFGYRCLYINATPKGVWSFDLTNMAEPRWYRKKLFSKTQWSTKNRKVDKEIAMLDLSLAKQITDL